MWFYLVLVIWRDKQLLNNPEQKNDIPVQAYQNSLPTQVSFSEIRRFSILQKI